MSVLRARLPEARYTQHMPKKGERAQVCKRGHDLTLPNARGAVPKHGRGGGVCRVCVVERSRAQRGSTKVGPSSRFTGDEVARLQALANGMKRCPRCQASKRADEFWKDKGTSDGLGAWCIGCSRQSNRQHYESNRDEIILRTQARRFGLSVTDLRRMLDEQGGTCAICERPCSTGRALAVDHDHGTGQVRALLCANCNRAIGLLYDSAELATQVANYLTRWQSDGQAGVSRTKLSTPH